MSKQCTSMCDKPEMRSLNDSEITPEQYRDGVKKICAACKDKPKEKSYPVITIICQHCGQSNDTPWPDLFDIMVKAIEVKAKAEGKIKPYGNAESIILTKTQDGHIAAGACYP